MRLLTPTLVLILAACGSPTSTGDGVGSLDTPDGGSTRRVGWAPHGTDVQRPDECATGTIACYRRNYPRDPASPVGSLFCVRPDTDVHCGACYTFCPSMVCVRGDAGVYACAP